MKDNIQIHLIERNILVLDFRIFYIQILFQYLYLIENKL